MDVGKFFKGLVIATIGYFAILALLFAANASVFTFVTSDQEKVKQIANDSGVYGELIPALLDQLGKEAQQGSKEARKQTGDLPVNNDEINQLVAESFDEEFTRGASESIVDGIYGWLKGQTEQPQFTIDIAKPKNQFINLATDYSYQRAQKLPECTFQQLLQAREFDVWSAPCAPPGITKAQIKSELRKQINGQKDSLLAGSKITQDDFKKEDGRSAFADLKGAPDAFSAAKWLPWFLVLIAALALGAIVYTSDTRSQGVRRAGITLLVSAVLIATVPSIVSFVLDKVLASDQQAEPISQDIFYPLITSFNEAASGVYYTFVFITALIGTVLVTISVRYKERLNKKGNAKSTE